MQDALKHLVPEMQAHDRRRGDGRYLAPYIISSLHLGLPALDTPRPELMQLQLERGLLSPVPLVLDLTTQYLQQNDRDGAALAALSSSGGHVVSHAATLLIAALERDRHRGILRVWNCRQPEVVADVLV